MKDEVINIRVDKSMKDQLQKLADKDNRKLGDYVRLQLKQLLEKLSSKK
jgi:antitoxin component of RelBE/YafQ-DinJ toxin-antitoxin module